MAAVTAETVPPEPGPAPAAVPRQRRRRASRPVWRWVILLIAAVYFLVPLAAALRFAGIKAFPSLFTQPGFWPSLWLSMRLAATTWFVTMLLMVPTTVYVHMRMPRVRRVLETVTILPIVIPPVVLATGVLQSMPLALKASVWLLGLEYVILAMPFAYRAIDAGLRSLDVKTLAEASNSLGGGTVTTLWRVILPNMRTAVISATVLIVALVLGEFTMASIVLKQTFPVWVVDTDQLNGTIPTAASLFALFVTWIILMAITVAATRQSRRTGGGEVTLFAVAPRETIGN
jgi:putative spermidine/putrescine transport system permease protein